MSQPTVTPKAKAERQFLRMWLLILCTPEKRRMFRDSADPTTDEDLLEIYHWKQLVTHAPDTAQAVIDFANEGRVKNCEWLCEYLNEITKGTEAGGDGGVNYGSDDPDGGTCPHDGKPLPCPVHGGE
ncbi:MAG: hypothetical protein ACW99U_14925 [Candidatus Thorarchaeota archaeon]|jgi:hypothetical protein